MGGSQHRRTPNNSRKTFKLSQFAANSVQTSNTELPHESKGNDLESSKTKTAPPSFSYSGSVDIHGASAEQAFAVYSHLPNHPQWASMLTEVVADSDSGHSTWSLRVLGLTLSWTAKVIEQVAPSRILWESTSGIQNQGTAEFTQISSQPPASRVNLRFVVQPPPLLQPLFGTQRFRNIVENALVKDLAKFREVALVAQPRVRKMPEDRSLVNATHGDSMGSCRVILWSNRSIHFTVQGFGTSEATEMMLSDLVEGMSKLSPDAEFSAIVDMRQGIGCSPLAVSPIVRFVRLVGDQIHGTAVVGPRPLVILAQFITRISGQPGVYFFNSWDAAADWIISSVANRTSGVSQYD